ncbi:MAG TPA: hypothetical protein VFH88_03645 [Candidatus Krumholzibacteria bacterium]|nr:hypothetical protein [Candidatus Krumholzibacteria bacterium]
MTRSSVKMMAAATAMILVADTVHASKVGQMPIATRVERAEIIVIGHVVSDSENKRAKWYRHGTPNEALLQVNTVIHGTPEFARTGTVAQVVRVLHTDDMQTTQGNFEFMYGDEPNSDEINGIWILERGELPGTYRGNSALQLRHMEFVRECLRALETGYAGRTPGITPDDQTWISSWSSTDGVRGSTVLHPSGDITIAGTFFRELQQDGKKRLTSHGHAAFAARLDSHGRTKWVHEVDPGQHMGSNVLCAADEDCLFLRGVQHKQFVTCVSPNGDVRWAVPLRVKLEPLLSRFALPDWGGLPEVRAVAMGDSCCLAGSYVGELTCGNLRISSRSWHWFTATVDGRGKVRDLTDIDRDREEVISRAVDGGRGDLIVAGNMFVSGHWEVFVSSLAGQSRPTWMNTRRTPSGGWLRDIAVGPDGAVFVATDDFLCAWDGTGTERWCVPGGGDDVEVGGDGHIYCLGSCDPDTNVVKSTVRPWTGDGDILLSCYDHTGRLLWSRRDGGLSVESPVSLHLLANRRAVITGRMEGTSFLAGHVVPIRGPRDMFVMNVPLPREQSGRQGQ